jgi:hypothetical protein
MDTFASTQKDHILSSHSLLNTINNKKHTLLITQYCCHPFCISLCIIVLMLLYSYLRQNNKLQTSVQYQVLELPFCFLFASKMACHLKQGSYTICTCSHTNLIRRI